MSIKAAFCFLEVVLYLYMHFVKWKTEQRWANRTTHCLISQYVSESTHIGSDGPEHHPGFTEEPEPSGDFRSGYTYSRFPRQKEHFWPVLLKVLMWCNSSCPETQFKKVKNIFSVAQFQTELRWSRAVLRHEHFTVNLLCHCKLKPAAGPWENCWLI